MAGVLHVVDTALETTALSCVEQATQLDVFDAASYTSAGDLLITLRTLKRRIEASYDPIIRKAHEAHKEALHAKAQHVEPVERAERLVKNAMAGYETREEERRLAEEATMLAEARGEAERRRTEAVAQLTRTGDLDAAERMAAEPLEVPAVYAPGGRPEIDGVTSRRVYRAVVYDFAALVRAVAEGRAPLAALKADLVFLNGQARALKQLLQYPGVRVEEERVVAVRR